MESNSKVFVPICFRKDLYKLSERLKLNKPNDRVMTKEIYTNVEAKDAYTIIKNLDLSISKSQTIEYSKQRIKLKEAIKTMKVSNSSDVYTLKLNAKFLKFFKYEQKYRLLRFYSFSKINNCYFFFYRLVDEKNDKLKICKGGIIIPLLEKKIFIYMKRSKKLSIFRHQNIFNIFIENLKVMLEVMSKFTTAEEKERLSTVETLDPDTDCCSIQKSDLSFKHRRISVENTPKMEITMKNCLNLEEEVYEEGIAGTSELDEYTSDPDNIIDYDWLDINNLDLTQKDNETFHSFFIHTKENFNNSNNKLLKFQLAKTNFVIDEDDQDYKIAKKLNQEDLEKVNYLEPFKKVLKLVKNDKDFSDFEENEIIRYVYGWKGNVENAFKSLKETKNWRHTYQPNLITIDDFANVNYNLHDLLSIPCQDVYGRPILLIKAKNLTSKIDTNVFLRYLIYTMEKAISMMPSNIEKNCLVIDINDAGISNFNMNFIKTVKDMTSKYYVERLTNIIVINKGFFFGMLWKVVSAFLDERILKKITVIDNTNMPWLHKIMGEEINKLY